MNVVTRGDTPEKHVATTSSQVGFREHEKLCGLSTDKPFGITEIEAKRVLPGWCGALLYGAPCMKNGSSYGKNHQLNNED